MQNNNDFKTQYEQELLQQEITANKNTLKGFVWFLLAVALVWIFTMINFFEVDKTLTSIAFLANIVLFFPPFYIMLRGDLAKPWLKYFLLFMLCLVSAVIISILSYHAVLLYVFPLLYAVQYREKKVIWYAYAVNLGTITLSSILMPDMRAHGKSEGIISFGIRERHDVRLWVNEVLKRFGQDTELILAGVSMGATSVLLTAHDAPLPKNLLCVISDCAFSHPKGLLRPIYEKNHLPAGLLYRIMKLSARVFGGFRLDEAVAVQSITGLSVPVLFIHGSLDQIVPASMCHELYEAYPGMKRKLVLDGANHANSALVFPEEYEEAVTEFLNEIISLHTEKQHHGLFLTSFNPSSTFCFTISA